MARPRYIETTCKTALNRVSGMPFKWSLNPYRGCVHACHYCYARATHAYFGLNADEDFESQIFVKTNLAVILRRELARPSWAAESVAIGTATDAYQPAEGRYRITRAALAALLEARNPLSIVTKSTLVLRDLDLLAALARLARVRVYFTITTLDHDLWRLVEPGTPPPLKRLAVLRRLNESGVPTGVLLAPILPGLTDSVASIEAVAAAAAMHGAVSLWASPLRLAPLVKEHYLSFVAATAPDLLPRYQRAYAGVNAPRAYVEGVEARVARIRALYGFAEDAARERLPASVAARGDEGVPRVGERQLALPL